MEITPTRRIPRATNANRHSKWSGIRLSIMFLQILLVQGLRDRRPERAAVARVLDDDGDGNSRIQDRRECHEPGMIAKLLRDVLSLLEVRARADGLRGPRLSGNVDKLRFGSPSRSMCHHPLQGILEDRER